MPPDKPPPDVTQPLYVSIRDGALVPRFTLAGKVSGLIGAERGEGRAYVWHPDRIVMIPAAEVAAHRTPYTLALAAGDIVPRTAEEYEAARAAQKKNRGAIGASPNGSATPAGGTDT
jgi:hypothetical protein